MIIIGIFFLIPNFILSKFFTFCVDGIDYGWGVDGWFGFEYWMDGNVGVKSDCSSSSGGGGGG